MNIKASEVGMRKGFKKGDLVYEASVWGFNEDTGAWGFNENTGVQTIRIRPLRIEAAGKKIIRATETSGDFIKCEVHSDKNLFRTLEEAVAAARACRDAHDAIPRSIDCEKSVLNVVLPEYRARIVARIERLKSLVVVTQVYLCESFSTGMSGAKLIEEAKP